MASFVQNTFRTILYSPDFAQDVANVRRAARRAGRRATNGTRNKKRRYALPLMDFKHGRTRYAEIKYIKIQVPLTIYNTGLVLQRYLEKNGYQTTIVQTITSKDITNNWNNPNEYYILLSCGVLTILPPPRKFFVYNLEQIRNYTRYPVTPIHRKALNQCIAILDYSQRNCEEYPPRLKQKTYFFPMPFTFISDKERIEPYMKGKAGSIGVLFFGSVNARRQNIMDHLRKSSGGRYNIVAGASFFGEELCEMVKRSKIILNLHFRPKNSLLETCRIHDCLTFGNAHILSLIHI